MLATKYYLNLNYVCNERCIFCASDLTNAVRLANRRAWVSLAEVDAWVAGCPPGPRDRVLLAGGEPTLHPELLPIVRRLSATCPDVTIFTNGLRLADPAFARACVAAGITHFEIALFGASGETHDAVTQVRGSFERTLTALNNLAALRRSADFTLELRLLVARQSSPENPAIVRVVHERVPGIDAVSLNRLILSEHASRTDATISWAEARPSINESARLIRAFGYELRFAAIPLCLFDEDNATFVSDAMAQRTAHIAAGLEPSGWETRYFDVFEAAGEDLEPDFRSGVALPAPCVGCAYLPVCGRVEQWYVQRYGTDGLRTVRATGEPRLDPAWKRT